MPEGDAQPGDAEKGEMATSRRDPCLQTERHHVRSHNHHEHGRKDHHRHRNAGGHATPDEG